jgi:K+ transporter
MVALATLATVIASQAVITGAYSLTRQAIQLGLLPRFEIRHTSESHSGQIYIPRINMLLFISVILLVVTFRSSSALASAYGISVTGTMVVTAMMGFVVIWRVWRWSIVAAAALIAPFLFLDLTFLAANLLKVFDVHVAARQPAIVREVTKTGISAARPGGNAGEASAAARSRDGRIPDQRPRQRPDRADAQPEALQGAA